MISWQSTLQTLPKTFHPGIIWEGSDKSCTMPFIGCSEWPIRPKAGADITIEQMGELSGNIEMKAGKAFHKLYITDDEGKLDFEGVGEKDGKVYCKTESLQPGITI